MTPLKIPLGLMALKKFNFQHFKQIILGYTPARAPESLPSKRYGLRYHHFLHEKAKNFLQNSNLKQAKNFHIGKNTQNR